MQDYVTYLSFIFLRSVDCQKSSYNVVIPILSLKIGYYLQTYLEFLTIANDIAAFEIGFLSWLLITLNSYEIKPNETTVHSNVIAIRFS